MAGVPTSSSYVNRADFGISAIKLSICSQITNAKFEHNIRCEIVNTLEDKGDLPSLAVGLLANLFVASFCNNRRMQTHTFRKFWWIVEKIVWSRSAFVHSLITMTTLVVTFSKMLLLHTFKVIQPISVLRAAFVVRLVNTTCTMCFPHAAAAAWKALIVLVVSAQTK